MYDMAKLGRKALRGALELRRKVGISFDSPICIYDVAENAGLSVWFKGGGSFGGMFSKSKNAILVPSLRPQGRQAYTCAHELGHWYFGHGSKLDAYEENEGCKASEDEERLADLFAGHLLMPTEAVAKAFRVRNISVHSADALSFYRVACQLGVGYTTLLNHLRWTLAKISPPTFMDLMKTTPKSIRESILNKSAQETANLLVVDSSWNAVPIDLQVGHMAVLPKEVDLSGESVNGVMDIEKGILVKAVKPGIAEARKVTGDWATFIRVSRFEFEGRSIYRHLEEVD